MRGTESAQHARQGFVILDGKFSPRPARRNAFAKDALYHTGQVEDQQCDFCGFHKQTIDHILWDCPCFAEVREQIDPGVAKWAPIMPACVRAGIAPIMTASLGTTFWGDRWIAELPKDALQLMGVQEAIEDKNSTTKEEAQRRFQERKREAQMSR